MIFTNWIWKINDEDSACCLSPYCCSFSSFFESQGWHWNQRLWYSFYHNVYKSAKIIWSINDGEDGFVTSFGVNNTPVVYKWSFLVLGGAINSNDLLLEDKQGFGHVLFWTLYRQTWFFHLTFSLKFVSEMNHINNFLYPFTVKSFRN